MSVATPTEACVSAVITTPWQTVMCNAWPWKSCSMVTIVFTSMLMLGMIIAIGVINSMSCYVDQSGLGRRLDSPPRERDPADVFNPVLIPPAIFTSLVMYIGSGLTLKNVSHPPCPPRCLPALLCIHACELPKRWWRSLLNWRSLTYLKVLLKRFGSV